MKKEEDNSLLKDEGEREIGGRLVVVGRYPSLGSIAEIKHKLSGIRVACIETVTSALFRMLNDVIRCAGVTVEIALRTTVNLLKVGLKEKGTIMVVDVLGQLFHADATLAYIQ